MVARLHLWWQQIKQHRITIQFIAIFLAIAIVLVLIGYQFDWTGFNGHNKSGKTLYDWMQLLFIPVVLAVAGFWFNHRERKAAELRAENEQEAAELRAEAEREIEQKRAEAERGIAEDNQREAALQAYIDKMAELLLHEGLRNSSEDAEVRRIATLQTLTTLPRLDGKRKGSVLVFLHEAGLIEKSNPIIMFGAAGLHGTDLRGCDLSGIFGASLHGGFISYAILDGADFTGVHLRGICFEGGSFCNARFIGTDLRDSQFFGTNLSGADLTGADLTNASLIAVNLTGTIVTHKQLDKAKSLQGATMPDGSIHH